MHVNVLCFYDKITWFGLCALVKQVADLLLDIVNKKTKKL